MINSRKLSFPEIIFFAFPTTSREGENKSESIQIAKKHSIANLWNWGLFSERLMDQKLSRTNWNIFLQQKTLFQIIFRYLAFSSGALLGPRKKLYNLSSREKLKTLVPGELSSSNARKPWKYWKLWTHWKYRKD